MERVEGIEPSTKAWEAFVLPLNYTRITRVHGALKRVVQQEPSLSAWEAGVMPFYGPRSER